MIDMQKELEFVSCKLGNVSLARHRVSRIEHDIVVNVQHIVGCQLEQLLLSIATEDTSVTEMHAAKEQVCEGLTSKMTR